jgi:predicted RNA-binding protein
MTLTELKHECDYLYFFYQSGLLDGEDIVRYVEKRIQPTGILDGFFHAEVYKELEEVSKADRLVELVECLAKSCEYSKEINLNDIKWLSERYFFPTGSVTTRQGVVWMDYPFVVIDEKKVLTIGLGYGHNLEYPHGANIYETDKGIYIDAIDDSEKAGIFLEVG